MSAVYNPTTDLEDYSRRMGARYMFRHADEKRDFNPRITLPSTWKPPMQMLHPNLQIYLRATKATILQHAKSVQPPSIHNMSRRHVNALRDLARRRDIRVIIADKNQGICVVTPTQYKELVEQHLSDTQFYECITESECAKSMTTITMSLGQIAAALKKHDERGAKFIVQKIPVKESRLPNFYILAKVHKRKQPSDPIPTRPIVASHSYITTPASIYLDTRLQPFMAKLSTVLKDTKTCIQAIEAASFPPDCVLVTADVQSLYTNMPTNDVLRSLKDFLTAQKIRDASLLVRIAEVVLRNNMFRFGRKTFRQLQGTAMGTPAAVVLANLFMSSCYDHRLIDELGEHAVLLYRRLIDDIFIVLRNPIPNLHRIMCSINSNITVTPEISTERIAFLDLNIYKGERFRSTGILDLSTHTKNTALFLYPPFRSFHPAHNKTALVMTELIRFIRNCSSIESFWKERDDFYHNLRSRGYPARLILRVFRLPNVQYSRRAEFLAPQPARVVKDKKTLVYTCTFTKHTHALPMTRLLREHWNLIENDPELAEIFPSPPITGWRVGKKIRNMLTKSKFVDDDDDEKLP